MPKVRSDGELYFPKRMSTLDKNIVQKVWEIRKSEKELKSIELEKISRQQELLNLQARQRELESSIRKNHDELLKLYDDKIWRDTVAFNR